ncbi:hypothetical protein PLESTB_000889400 [Pleodorina starrii]|uniref:Peptidase M11 gametolysin domain-containing protein n=1 Tax=Pleodorina starrii TaxID=330485 RepID=A0A9W6BLH5_9CHLO|nr:hypothetical protein PLESTB_000806000 [Pleodorina starrii]GLC54630.1 hypothetical protein PLESTB_000889400 [Pleodorina starrii]
MNEVVATEDIVRASARGLRNKLDKAIPGSSASSSSGSDGRRRLLADGVDEVYTEAPNALRAVVYLVDFCGWKNPFRSPQEFRKYLFANETGALEANLQSYYGTCSYGKATWDPANVVVVGPIQLECQGRMAGGTGIPFNAATSCSLSEEMYWTRAAEQQGQQLAVRDPKLKEILQFTKRRRSMVILPSDAKCGFSGHGDQACQDICSTVVMARNGVPNIYSMFHELQHNYGLGHAGRAANPYGDGSDPMGTHASINSGLQCHNAPQNWRMGWAGPIPGGHLTAANFTPAANRLTLTIPAASTSDQNMVILRLGLQSPQPGAPAIAYPNYFISYRVRNATFGGYDSGLPAAFHRKVTIHAYNGTTDDRDGNTTSLQDAGPRFTRPDSAFPAGDGWMAPFSPLDPATGLGGGLRVRVVSTSATSAVVELCRMYAQTEGVRGSADCRTNLDRDCDGLIGAADPDCK